MGKVRFYPVVGDADGLFETGHEFSDLEVNPDVRTECAVREFATSKQANDRSQREFATSKQANDRTLL